MFSGGIKWEYWSVMGSLLAELLIINMMIAKGMVLPMFFCTKKTSRSLSFSLAFLTGKITLWGKVSEYATRFASFTFEFGKLIFVSSA